MIYLKNAPLAKKEKQEIQSLFSEIFDPYCDFYVTKNNRRLFIRENSEILFNGIAKGDCIAYNETGIATIIGISDKSDRKYLRFLVRQPALVGNLLVALLMEKYEGILYTKLKYNNPSIPTLLGFGFVEVADRGEEVLLKKDKHVQFN